jgi:acyl-CoA-binding protein
MGHHKLKGKTKEQARAIFCKLLNDALADKAAHFYP